MASAVVAIQVPQGLGQEKVTKAQHAQEAQEIADYFKNLKRPQFEVIDSDVAPPEAADLTFFGSNPNNMATTTGTKGRHEASTMERAHADPTSKTLVRFTEPRVLQKLRDSQFRRLDLRDPQTVNLNPPAAARGSVAEGSPAPVKDDIAPTSSRWSVTWGLKCDTDGGPIPLWQPAQVKALYRDGELRVDLGNTPTDEQLPSGPALVSNVDPAVAAEVAKDNFLDRNKKAGNPLGKADLVTIGPAKELCPDESQAKPARAGAGAGTGSRGATPYRLAYAVSVGVKPGKFASSMRGTSEVYWEAGKFASPMGVQYWVEAVAKNPKAPQIITSSASVFHACGEFPEAGSATAAAHSAQPAPQALPEGKDLISNTNEDQARGIAIEAFRSRDPAHPLTSEEVIGVWPKLMLHADERPGMNGFQRLAWRVIVTVRPSRPIPSPPVEYWVQAHVNDGQRPEVLASAPCLRKRFAGQVRCMIFMNGISNLDPVNNLPIMPLNHFFVRINGEPPTEFFETQRGGEYVFFGNAGSQVPFLLEGPVCKVPMAPGAPVRMITPVPAVAGTMNIDLLATNPQEAALTSAFFWINSAFDTHHLFLGTQQIRPSVAVQLFANLVGQKEVIKPRYEQAWSDQPGSLFFPRDLDRYDGRLAKFNGCCPDIVVHEFGHAIDQLTFRVQTKDPLYYSEGFADAFAILCRKDRVVGRDLRGPDKHLRDYRKAKCSVVLDQKETEVFLKFDGQLLQKYIGAFSDQYGDDVPHFFGRVYAHFVCDLIDRFTPPLGQQRAFERVATLVFLTDRADPPSLLDAITIMLTRADQDEQAVIRQVARDRGLY
jgi:hypothetical protein